MADLRVAERRVVKGGMSIWSTNMAISSQEKDRNFDLDELIF